MTPSLFVMCTQDVLGEPYKDRWDSLSTHADNMLGKAQKY